MNIIININDNDNNKVGYASKSKGGGPWIWFDVGGSGMDKSESKCLSHDLHVRVMLGVGFGLLQAASVVLMHSELLPSLDYSGQQATTSPQHQCTK